MLNVASLRRVLPRSAPLVGVWAAWQQRRAMRLGRPLSPEQLQIAAAVGVRDGERIRLLLVERMPFPAWRLVGTLSRQLRLPGPDVDGLTLGHAIIIRRGALTPPLLAHECRHVQQYEAAGSLRRFLGEYLRQVAQHGYRDAAFEADARDAAARWTGH